MNKQENIIRNLGSALWVLESNHKGQDTGGVYMHATESHYTERLRTIQVGSGPASPIREGFRHLSG
jgi:hypothetical protein